MTIYYSGLQRDEIAPQGSGVASPKIWRETKFFILD